MNFAGISFIKIYLNGIKLKPRTLQDKVKGSHGFYRLYYYFLKLVKERGWGLGGRCFPTCADPKSSLERGGARGNSLT